jgi:periplasmic protein TonB
MFEQTWVNVSSRRERWKHGLMAGVVESTVLALAAVSSYVVPPEQPDVRLLESRLPVVPAGRAFTEVKERPTTAAPARRMGARSEGTLVYQPPAASLVDAVRPLLPLEWEPEVGGIPGSVTGEDSVRSNSLGEWLRQAERSGATEKVTAAAPAAEVSLEPPPRIRIGGNVQAAKLIRRITPRYPVLALQTRVSGTVKLEAVIGSDGKVQSLRLISGHPLLVESAMRAVRAWEYSPTFLNGEPVEVLAPIDVHFSLQ